MSTTETTVRRTEAVARGLGRATVGGQRGAQLMTRETKIGIVVACSFLCLVGAVYYLKKNESSAAESSPVASLPSGVAGEDPPPTASLQVVKPDREPPLSSPPQVLATNHQTNPD